MESPSQLSPSLPSLLLDGNTATFPGASGGEEEEDAFLGFVEHARAVLSAEDGLESDGDHSGRPSWCWVASRILKTCGAYSSGVTPGILLSDLFQAWNEQHRYATSKKRGEILVPFEKRRRRTRLVNTVTIDAVYEKNFLSQTSILEAIILDAFLLPGTNIYMLNLGDMWSSSTIEIYLHRRYYHLVDLESGILKKGREIFLTGCCLRSAMEGSGHSRLLPTEYLVILLDEDRDDDAMFLGAQFCSDSFSSISHGAVEDCASYSFYARIESIGPLEVHGTGVLQRKEISLVDNDGIRLKFVLWGEQVLLANLFSVGSMLAVDRPFIAHAVETNMETNQEICLEYGSATQLYLVPFVQPEEQVLLASTQMRYQGSRSLSALGQNQHLKPSQVSLPLDSRGSINFSNYPFRAYVIDLCEKMTGISLYGVITDICREKGTERIVFSLKIEDTTGAIGVKLHFVKSWSLGRLSVGHVIYISGLSCSMSPENLLEVLWFEKDPGSSFFNLSCLPALLNSSCLHELSYISNVGNQRMIPHICSVRLDQIVHDHVHSILCHALCGHSVNEAPDGSVTCSLCNCSCDDDLVRSFYFKVALVDDSAKIFAWCMGQAAAELLQISSDEFFDLPEDEQAMYLYTVGSEIFIVSIVNSKWHHGGASVPSDEENDPAWEIARVQKCE